MTLVEADRQDTIRAVLSLAVRTLAEAGIPDGRRDAHLLLAHAIGTDRSFTLTQPHRMLSRPERAAFETLVERRARREPVAQILGRREFWSLDFLVNADVLDPRPDSETLIEGAIEIVASRDNVSRILDLGTGSGCLLLSLLSEFPTATGLGTDISSAALNVARQNAEALNLTDRACFLERCWGEGLDGLFNLIVTNPPYVADEDISQLEPEVAHFEPRLALSGGEDGLQAYRDLAPDVKRLLAPGGIALFEVGHNQDVQVAEILASVGLEAMKTWRDLSGITRCLGAKRAL